LAKSAPRPAGAQHELERHLEATAPGAQVEPGRLPETFRVRLALPASPPLVSIIIPTRDRVELLRGCIESIRARTAYPAYEILVVDNGSTDAATLRYLAQLTQSGQARVIPSPGPFNYAALNNTAARQARGDVLVLLNNDIQIDQPEWLGELVSWALRDDVGIVGCRLRYGNGRLQHVGVTVGLHGLAAHVHRGLGRDDPGSGGMAWTLREAGAVTAACVAIRKAVFDEAGGFEEKLPVAFNDVELCLRIREKGLAALFTPHADVLHLESASRGNDDSPEKQEQTARAADLTRALHPDTTREDPYYNPNLSLESIDAALAFPPRVFRSWRGERADRPRIAFLTYRLKKGYGVDIVVAEQIEYFCARGYQVLVLVLEKDTFFDERLRGYVSAGLLRVQQVASPSEAAQIATSAGSEIAVAHTPPFFTSLREIPTSTLRVILDYGEPPAELFPDTEVRLRIAQEKRAISQEIDLSVAISEFIRRDSGLASSEVCWLGNDHLLRRRGNVKALAGRFRAEHGLHAEFLVLNVTRFLEMERRYKGVDAYAEIRDALVRSHPELADRVRFVLAGRCEPADKAWAEGRGLFAVSNLDDDQLLAAYTDANAYVTMSQWEGCNLGLAQALALGIPSMASARGAHVEFPTISTSNDPQVVADWIAQEVARQSSAGPLTPERSLRRLRTAWSYPWKRSCSQLENLLGAAMQARKLSRHRMPAPLEQESAEAAALQVSFVILNKDKPEFLPACVQSIEQRCKVPFEILIGDTGSTDPETLQFYESTRHAVHYLGFYNFSACNNVLAARARGRYLVFLNNDTKLIEADFAAALAYLEGHPEAGCLGGYLVYADQRIQHAGVRICPQEPYRGIPEHFDRFKPLLDYPGLAGPREVVAVTGALLLVSADRFAQVEGFDEVYVEEAQDIDLCLRLRRQGLNSVMHPALRAYHYENGTRTAREAPHDRAEFLRRFGQTIEDELYAWQEAAGLG
jgi:GT2 family glycosyltransferase